MTVHNSCITKRDMKCTNVTASYIKTKITELYASVYDLQELKNKTLIMMMIHK